MSFYEDYGSNVLSTRDLIHDYILSKLIRWERFLELSFLFCYCYNIGNYSLIGHVNKIQLVCKRLS